MEDLHRMSRETRYFLSQINWCVACAHTGELDDTSGDPVLSRLRALAESLIILMDSSEFEDVNHVANELRIDPETGDLRDLPALLRATDEEIEQADMDADTAEADHEASADTVDETSDVQPG